MVSHNSRKIRKQENPLVTVIIPRSPNSPSIDGVFIQNKLIDRKSDVSRLINRIEKLGLIERRQNKEDKRISEIYLTLRGLELLGQIRVIDKFYKDKMPQKLTKIHIFIWKKK